MRQGVKQARLLGAGRWHCARAHPERARIRPRRTASTPPEEDKREEKEEEKEEEKNDKLSVGFSREDPDVVVDDPVVAVELPVVWVGGGRGRGWRNSCVLVWRHHLGVRKVNEPV